VNEGMLFETFNNVGLVSSIRVCRDHSTRRSLGYAYVNFHSVVDAERALDILNNNVIAGRPCRIMWSQRDPSVRKRGVGNIFIKDLEQTIGHKELHDTFSAFGNILSCKVAMDEHGVSKGYGFVHFENQQCADTAVQMVNNNELLGKKVYVGPFIPRKDRIQQLEQSWTNLFVKEIDASIDDKALEKAFSEYGTVTSAKIMRGPDGASLGFGFTNFEDHESAKKAVDTMNGFKLGNKILFCCRAQKKAEREAKLKKDWEQQKISKYQGINLYIKNIEDDIDEERLRKEFAAHGTIKSCKIMTDEKGKSKGFGFVCYNAPEESQRALADLNGRILPGCQKPLYVALHEPKEIRRQKLTLNALKGLRGAQHSALGAGAGPMYSPTGQPVYYQSPNLPQGYVYPQQGLMPSMPRGWQTQYSVPYPNSSGVIPGRGGAQAASSRGRGGSSRGAAASSGGAVARGGRAARQPSAAPESTQQIEFYTLAQVKAFPGEQQKVVIGERLYYLISRSQPQLAGKITGMFLESGWSTEDLYSLLTDEAKLGEKIDDALAVLQNATRAPEGEENV